MPTGVATTIRLFVALAMLLASPSWAGAQGCAAALDSAAADIDWLSSRDELAGNVELRRLDPPEVTYFATYRNSTVRFEKVELAEYVRSSNTEIQHVLDFVQRNGGQVRLVKSRDRDLSSGVVQTWYHEPAYFWTNTDENSSSYLIPVIAIDLAQDHALAALHHELVHFKIWLSIYQGNLARGFNRQAAVAAANAEVIKESMILDGEKQAIAAEMQIDREFPHHPFNRPRGMVRAREFWHPTYVNRVTYPEFSAIVNLFRDASLKGGTPNVSRVKFYLKYLIGFAEENRRRALTYLKLDPSHVRHPSYAELAEKFGDLSSYWQSSSVYTLVSRPSGLERFPHDGSVALFRQLFHEACNELGIGSAACGVWAP